MADSLNGLENVVKIDHPFGIIGLSIFVLSTVITVIIKAQPKGRKNNPLYLFISRWMFRIVLLALVLGLVGWMYDEYLNKRNSKITLEANIYDERGEAIDSLVVAVDDLELDRPTNKNGKFIFTYFDPTLKHLHLHFRKHTDAIDTIIIVDVEEWPKEFVLKRIIPPKDRSNVNDQKSSTKTYWIEPAVGLEEAIAALEGQFIAAGFENSKNSQNVIKVTFQPDQLTSIGGFSYSGKVVVTLGNNKYQKSLEITRPLSDESVALRARSLLACESIKSEAKAIFSKLKDSIK